MAEPNTRGLFQRPIKFRVWRSGVMIYSLGLPIIGMYEDALLLQFTGLYDKNGAEIYEGDVILSKRRIGTLRFRRLRLREYKCIAQRAHAGKLQSVETPLKSGKT